jgi:RNA polymerase sigma-70 factor (ECF subfamily)
VVALRETARVAVLLVMERLSPAERVAFVLHEAFGMDFGTIAEVAGRTPAACRQLASRARRRIRREALPRNDPAAHHRVVAAFLDAAGSGDLTELVGLLDPEIVMRSDGGGRVPSARPVYGREGVLALLAGLGRRYADATGRPIELAGGLALALYRAHAPLAILSLETLGDHIVALNLVTNPDKLIRFAASATE